MLCCSRDRSPIIRPLKGHALAEVLLTKPSKANGKGGQKGMEITVKSEVGQPEVVREVGRLEGGSLRSETLGLSLAEARAIWVGWRKRWPNGKPRSSSRKGGAVPI